jgi:Na+-translocating ferredoxin:NAD+ oxidoreductase RnfD subunit
MCVKISSQKLSKRSMQVAAWLSAVIPFSVLLVSWTEPENGVEFAAGLVLAVLAFLPLTVALTGLLLTAVLPPLPPIADVSLLGRRAVGLTKFALATLALFSTAFIGWLVTVSYEEAMTSAEGFANATESLGQFVLIPIVGGAMVFWMWLSVDLLRVGVKRRRNALDVLLHHHGSFLGSQRRLVRGLLHDLVGGWKRIVASFYVVPLVVVAFAQVQTAGL